MSEESAIAATIAARPELESLSGRLRVAVVDDFPEFECVTLTAEDGRPLIGGTIYVVADDGQVYDYAGGLPPRKGLGNIRAQRAHPAA
jgi:hypothetical protein